MVLSTNSGSFLSNSHVSAAFSILLRFGESRQFGIDTCMANGPIMRGNPTAHRTQPSLPVSQALAPCARQPGFRARRQALIITPKSTLHESRMRSENHYTSPSLLRTTQQSESVGQPGQSTTSMESPKVKNHNPILHLIQHHLALLHASSRGNDRIDSWDLLDSGG